jgi:NitT/TauT family transport system permease protein
VDASQVNLFRMYNASRLQEFLHLRLPSSIPYILTGIRVSSGLAIIGAIVGQFLLGSGDPAGGGLGYEIQYAAHEGLWGMLGAAAITSALLGITVFIILGILSNLALHNWHESAVHQEN